MNAIAKNKTVNKISLSLLGAILMVSVGQKSALACTPVPITPWFTEELSFVETNLPPTVSHPSELNFLNTEDSPFYFLYNGETKDMGTQLLFHINVYEDYEGIDVNHNYFSEFEHRNKIGDNRPENTLPPNFQDVIIPITLDDKQYAIKLRITYEINQNYNPKSIAMQNINCSYEESFLQYFLKTPVIVGLAFLIALSVVVIIRKQKSSNEHSSRIGK